MRLVVLSWTATGRLLLNLSCRSRSGTSWRMVCGVTTTMPQGMPYRAHFDRITISDKNEATLEPKLAIAMILAASPRPHNERTLPSR